MNTGRDNSEKHRPCHGRGDLDHSRACGGELIYEMQFCQLHHIYTGRVVRVLIGKTASPIKYSSHASTHELSTSHTPVLMTLSAPEPCVRTRQVRNATFRPLSGSQDLCPKFILLYWCQRASFSSSCAGSLSLTITVGTKSTFSSLSDDVNADRASTCSRPKAILCGKSSWSGGRRGCRHAEHFVVNATRRGESS